jgi:hypothetical protein
MLTAIGRFKISKYVTAIVLRLNQQDGRFVMPRFPGGSNAIPQ